MILTDEILEPVYNEKKELCWLTRKYKTISTGSAKIIRDENNKNPKIINDTPLEEIPVFELKPHGLWQCQKCTCLILSIPDKPMVCSTEQGGCDRQSAFTPYTKVINPDFWKIPYWQDIPDTTGIYDTFYNTIKKCIVFVEDIQYKIFTLDIISSYFMDQWETIGYPAFIGLIESGKSRALDLIAETGWRMINAGSGVSFPAMVRGTHLYNAGILIDEAHDKLTNKTETGQQMIDFLKPGYRRGSHYIIADKENPEKIISYNNFGFKAFAGEKEFDRAMMSRCKVNQMEQDYPEIQNLKDIRNKLNIIQTTLLNLKYKRKKEIPQIPVDIGINGRNLEIFEHTIRTAMFLGLDYQDVVEYAKLRKEEEIESFKDTLEWEVLKTIRGEEENEKLPDAPSKMSYNDLLNKLQWKEIEGQQHPAQKLGYIFSKKLQLQTKRDHGVTYLILNDKNNRRLKYLYRRYRVV